MDGSSEVHLEQLSIQLISQESQKHMEESVRRRASDIRLRTTGMVLPQLRWPEEHEEVQEHHHTPCLWQNLEQVVFIVYSWCFSETVQMDKMGVRLGALCGRAEVT